MWLPRSARAPVRRLAQPHRVSLVLPAQVQLLGQPISVGRPSGYVDPSAAQAAALKAAEALDRCVGPCCCPFAPS